MNRRNASQFVSISRDGVIASQDSSTYSDFISYQYTTFHDALRLQEMLCYIKNMSKQV